ncbi:MAG: histidine kinase [Fluviicola sp.]|nr:histidine kinase [Fluviicola sp.]
MNTKRFYWLAQLLGWLSYSGLVLLSVYTDNPDRIDRIFLTNILVLIVTGILATHIQRIVFIKLGWLSLRLPKLLPRLILASLACSIFISSIDMLTDFLSGIGEEQANSFSVSNIIVNIFSALILVLFWNAIYFTFHFFQQSRRQEVSNLELKASNRESELKNLRSQLNPHFLFNSLNSIRALIDLEPDKAKVSITTLSNLLRQSLILGRQHQVSLEEEMQLAKNYLELEKVRFEERLRVEWVLTPGLENFQVPPFTLQMMVENAIKHGISNLKDGGTVKVSVSEDEKEVTISVTNSGSLSGVTDLGVGIKNIKKRLLLQYGENAIFTLNEEDGNVISKMKFKK